MKIDRSQLIAELETFVRNDNGVIVGPPGVGKTYALIQLRERLKQSSTPHLILPIERLGAATESEIRAILQKDGDFIQLLQTAVIDAQVPAILIFDGYDAARGEDERAGVLRMIGRAVTELKDKWHVIVSVRTFDARKSRRLLELFPDKGQPSSSTAGCRQFVVPTLMQSELEQAFTQILGLKEIHASGNADFKTLLTIPFNLWLIERVLASGARSADFSQVTSEVQLLEMYWRKRIRNANNSEDRDYVLKKATAEMVATHTLSVHRDRVYQPQIKDAWSALLSDEIIKEVPEREISISFSHNILFDFAVSVYLLDPEPKKLASFVAEEPGRPFFLRPSLVYHFTRLWHFNRHEFWKNFWSVIAQEASHLRQIVRLVLPTVVVNEARTIDEIRPLLQRLENEEPNSDEAVSFLLQALRILQSPRFSLWAAFIRALGRNLNPRFAWDAGLIGNWIVDAGSKGSVEAHVDSGHFGRELLAWAWAGRKDTAKRKWFERLVAFIAVPLVAKTYGANQSASRAELEKILTVLGEPDFPIDCIYRLTNEIERIFIRDPEFACVIYEKIFGYEETSKENTHMGGFVMPMISNRRQDYAMCRYSLMTAFPKYLSINPMSAIKAGIRAIQAYEIQEHVLRYIPEGNDIAKQAKFFVLRNSTAAYLKDDSAVWDETRHPDQEVEIASSLFEWLANAAKENRTEDIHDFLQLFGAECVLAFLWSRLLRVAAAHPRVLGTLIWEVAAAKPILEGNDCLYALGIYLERSAEFLTHEQRIQIENGIMGLTQGAQKDDLEYCEHRRNRLLACIKSEFLVTAQTKALRSQLSQNNALPVNQPLFNAHVSWQPYTEKKYLQEQGVKLESTDNQALQNLYKPLVDWENKNKPEEEIDGLLPNALALRESLRLPKKADAAVIRVSWTHLATFACDALRSTNVSGSNRFQMLRDLVLESAKHEDPKPNPKYDLAWESASWSPAPRNDAAQAIPWLTHFGEDKEALVATEALLFDPVPSVRFLIACELWRLVEHSSVFMWNLIERCATTENNEVVLQGLIVSLWQLIRFAKDDVFKTARVLLVRLGDETDDQEKARSQLICMLVDFAIWEDNNWAKSEIERWQKEPLKFPASMMIAGHRLVEYIKIEHLGPGLEKARGMLLSHLNAIADGLVALQRAQDQSTPAINQAKWKRLYSVIDDAVMRIYFAADINSQLKERREHPLNDEERWMLFQQALPLLEKILSFGKQPETGTLLAPTAHHFVELLNGVVGHDPKLIIRMTADVILASKRFNYNLDSLAMGEIVKLVEAILADYRESVQDDTSIKNLLTVLDAFIEAGWPEALNLVWRLDEIYR